MVDADRENCQKLLDAGWQVTAVSLYDEEGIEGWMWEAPNGDEHTETGVWDEPPTIPDAAIDFLKASTDKSEPPHANPNLTNDTER